MPDIITQSDHIKDQPVIGESSEKYLDTLKNFSKQELDRLRSETLRIYRSFNFISDTALVVGRIQSGKTTSFVNLTAIAHDNNIPLVIIIAGVSKTLTSQTFEETQKLSDSDEWTSVYVSSTSDIPGVMSPKDKNFSDEVLNNLKRFNVVPEKLKKSQLLVVMKEDDNLEHLKVALKRIPERILNLTKTLIIDDEVDQYGLNSKVSDNKKSTIYQKIQELREVFQKHTYVGYTATPQANLLIQLKDMMSPDYLFSITPGDYYIGGPQLFSDLKNTNKNLEIIDEFNLDNDNDRIPNSLKKALLEFCIIVTNSIFNDQDPKRPVTMLIHPCRLTDSHKLHVRWVNLYMQHMEMQSKRFYEESPFKDELIKAHNFFKDRRKDFISIEETLKNIQYIFTEIKVKEQNTRNTGSIEKITWKDQAYIVVAGMNADRGTQIKGLVSTYLSRSAGARRMDTLQQRARFFGYKKSYLDLIRIYTTQESAQFFHEYIQHEEYLHKRIEEAKGIMPDVRKLLMIKGYDLTRPNVYDGGQKIGKNETQIASQRPHNQNFSQKNKFLVTNFINAHFKNIAETSKQHPCASVKEKNISDLLFSMNFGNCMQFNKIKTVFSIIHNENEKENPAIKYDVYLMGSGKARERKTKDDGTIEQLLQGRGSNLNNIDSYPGDKHFINTENISFQLHHNLWKEKGISSWTVIMFIPKNLRTRMQELNIFVTDR